MPVHPRRQAQHLVLRDDGKPQSFEQSKARASDFCKRSRTLLRSLPTRSFSLPSPPSCRRLALTSHVGWASYRALRRLFGSKNQSSWRLYSCASLATEYPSYASRASSKDVGTWPCLTDRAMFSLRCWGEKGVTQTKTSDAPARDWLGQNLTDIAPKHHHLASR